MGQVHLVTVADYDDAVIIGAFSTEEAARTAADEVDVLAFGRF